MKYTEEDFNQVIQKITKEVHRRAQTDRDNAGFAGEWGDRGAADRIKRLDYFLAGLNRTIPKEYESMFKTFLKELHHEKALTEASKDPDYALYQELEARFGHLKEK